MSQINTLSKFASIGTIVGLLIGIIGLFLSYNSLTTKNDKSQLLSVQSQVNKLNKISVDLKDLQQFIEEQKSNLTNEHLALQTLKNEKKNLEQLVEVDKEIVESLFIQQEKRQRKSIWNERAFGFFIGIISSLLASLIYSMLSKRKLKLTGLE